MLMQLLLLKCGQNSDRSMGYLLETKNHNLIMIDGGLPEYSEHVITKIKEKGGVVDAWFITHAHVDHASVLIDAIKCNEIQINNIYVSLNGRDWYEKHEVDEDRIKFANDLIDILASDGVRDRVHEVALRDDYTIDNLNFKILKTKNPEYTDNAGNNQSMVIKVSNNFKSLLFLGDLGEEYQNDFIDNNLDEIKCDAVQMAHHGQAGVNEKVYEKIRPSICFWPTPEWLWNNDSGDGYGTGNWKTLDTRSWIEYLKVTENYVAKDGDITVEIW